MNDSEVATMEAVPAPGDKGAIVVPLHAEELVVRKEARDTSRVRITTLTKQHEELVDELLAREQVEVERIAVGKPITAIPAVRQEGDTVVVPIVEEVLVVERRLVLKEEVFIRRIRTTQRHQERVTLRTQEAVISRLPLTETTEASSILEDRSDSHTQEKR